MVICKQMIQGCYLLEGHIYLMSITNSFTMQCLQIVIIVNSPLIVGPMLLYHHRYLQHVETELQDHYL